MKLDRTTVADLKLPPGRAELIVFDEKLKGFGVRLRAGGKRTWIVQYRVGKKQRRKTLGSVEKIAAGRAREVAEHDLADATLGSDPQAKKKESQAREAITLEATAKRFLSYQKGRLKPRSYEQVETHLTNHWALFNEKPLHTITRFDVADRLGKIASVRGPYAANRARATLSSFYAWAMKEGVVDLNPVISTNRQTDEKARDRVLTDAELAAIWKSCNDDDYGRIVRLLILTGQRRDEVGAMARSEVDTAARKWTIPVARTKNSQMHEVPLSNSALAIVKQALSREGREDRERLFGEADTGFSGWSKARLALDKRIAEEAEKTKPARRGANADRKETEPVRWRVHDIRRTGATRMADLGVLPHIIEAVLNHISGHKGGVAGVYNRALYSAEKRQALDLWAAHVEALLAGKSASNIVPLKA
jgi:integrase